MALQSSPPPKQQCAPRRAPRIAAALGISAGFVVLGVLGVAYGGDELPQDLLALLPLVLGTVCALVLLLRNR